MLACVDVDYSEERTCVACVTFKCWESDDPAVERVLRLAPDTADYVSGEFYRRELPPLLEVLNPANTPELTAVIVDGYVWLGPDRPGMGWHLHQALGEQVPVVGVAKNPFAGNGVAIPILRGESVRPLYVTAEGLAPTLAADAVSRMGGEWRMPDLLRRVDRLCREG